MDYQQVRKVLTDYSYQQRSLYDVFPQCRVETIIHVIPELFEEFSQLNNTELEKMGISPGDVEDIVLNSIILRSMITNNTVTIKKKVDENF